MPISKENRDRYPDNWKEIRAAVLERAKNRCEWCGLPQYAVGSRDKDGRFLPIQGNIYADCAGNGQSYPSLEPLTYAQAREWADESNQWHPEDRLIVIVLTIAHVHDHSPENCDMENLKAGCQRCHLMHDREHHANSRKRNRKRNSGQLTLFEESP